MGKWRLPPPTLWWEVVIGEEEGCGTRVQEGRRWHSSSDSWTPEVAVYEKRKKEKGTWWVSRVVFWTSRRWWRQNRVGCWGNHFLEIADVNGLIWHSRSRGVRTWLSQPFPGQRSLQLHKQARHSSLGPWLPLIPTLIIRSLGSSFHCHLQITYPFFHPPTVPPSRMF